MNAYIFTPPCFDAPVHKPINGAEKKTLSIDLLCNKATHWFKQTKPKFHAGANVSRVLKPQSTTEARHTARMVLVILKRQYTFA